MDTKHQPLDGYTCEKCAEVAKVSVRRKITHGDTLVDCWTSLCYDCFYAYQDAEREASALKNLTQLVMALRDHAYAYTFHDGRLVADLRQAANYLEAVANA